MPTRHKNKDAKQAEKDVVQYSREAIQEKRKQSYSILYWALVFVLLVLSIIYVPTVDICYKNIAYNDLEMLNRNDEPKIIEITHDYGCKFIWNVTSIKPLSLHQFIFTDNTLPIIVGYYTDMPEFFDPIIVDDIMKSKSPVSHWKLTGDRPVPWKIIKIKVLDTESALGPHTEGYKPSYFILYGATMIAWPIPIIEWIVLLIILFTARRFLKRKQRDRVESSILPV